MQPDQKDIPDQQRPTASQGHAEQRLAQLLKANAHNRRFRRRVGTAVAWVAGALLVLGTAVTLFGGQWNVTIGRGQPLDLGGWIVVLAGSLLAVVATLRLFDIVEHEPLAVSKARLAADKAEDEISGADDLMGLIRANRKQMEAYDVLARQHGSSSHRASLTAMVIGLAMVGTGLAVAWFADDSATKYSAAIIAATATAAGGFIAQTFIRVQQRAQDQMQFYFRQPLDASYLLTAERLASQLPEPARGKQYTRIITAALAQTGSNYGSAETKQEAPDPGQPASAPDVPDASS
ncbi:hypothetical protein ACFYUD_34080 [Nocardia tengchongensis]|uniref:TRADD-N-associated membrane domain-containing protein n=1 Tax=Nocardia tengchongensis TaxID=2055889 RepID=UPI00369D9495